MLEETLLAAPDEPAVTQTLGFAHLFAGHWREGFRIYERRHHSMRYHPEFAGAKVWIDYIDRALAAVPAWTEGPCKARRLLLWTEQGMGDAIMLMRLLPVLRADHGVETLTVLCPPPLASFRDACDDVSFIVADESWQARPGQFDAQCSIMSLPHLLDMTPDPIPGTVPYLRVPAAARAAWQERANRLEGLKVGLVWAGNPRLTLDTLRSIALQQLQPVLDCKGVSFVSLQKEASARDELRAGGWPLTDWMDECDDFMATAALIDALDLVIAVDTAAVHLAGALGKPVWLLNRFESEWRWGRDQDTSPWYPSLRIFNQTESRNWGPVIQRLAGELSQLAASRGA